jgi:hypothetical protein
VLNKLIGSTTGLAPRRVIAAIAGKFQETV